MECRELGRSGLKVPPICFGGNVFGWTADEARSFALLDALLDTGLAFIDTAEKCVDPRGMRVITALDTVGVRHGAKPAAVALAWMMAKPAITAPIASATSVEQLADLVAATRLTLDFEDVRTLDEASAPLAA
jgi:aryl-alcohol dehydrogenase-like predicted oxidoreductase